MTAAEPLVATSAQPRLLSGASIALSAPAPLAAMLEAGLRALGADVAILNRSPASRADAIDLLASAGTADALVYAPPVANGADKPFDQTGEDAWIEEAETPIWRAMVLFQAAYASFGERGGSIVAVLPASAVTGAAGLVAFSAAAEGIRQLVKSAARAWGRQGTRVNCVLLPLEDWGLEPEHPVPNRYGASLDGANGASDVAGAVASLLSPLTAGVTGATLGVDRGSVLAP
jgi:NAD(P)-dependent dehydrogenase (short-subunit alcohol dehydrogenase family)